MPSESLLAPWERLHAWGVRQPVFQRFTEITRVLLSAGFFGPGLVKLTGHHFAEPGMGDVIGNFFDALFATGLYWRFIGGAQVAAAVLLMVPALASIGNMVMFVVILNIFVITASLQFAGTIYLTGLMLLASSYLLLWDYPRWKLMLPGTRASERPAPVRIPPSERAGYVLCALSGWMVFSVMRGFIPADVSRWLVYAGLALAPIGALLVMQAWVRAVWGRRAAKGAAEQPAEAA